MDIFINEGINQGIVNYIKYMNNEEIDKVHYFEFYVIKTLTIIYGEINIINPFKLKKEESFYKNLSLFGLKKSELNLFINYLDEYNKWLNKPDSLKKTKLITQIQTIIINMILLKSNFHKISNEEILKYDEFLKPEEGDLKKVYDLISLDSEFTKSFWERKKHHISPGITLEKVEPVLLPEDEYIKFGFTMEELKKLPNMKINEINDKILKQKAEEEAGGRAKFDPRKLVLTSGSGFVDTLVLLSIIVTEIMIGFLITLAIMRW